MQCPSCGAQNPDVARFCANCRAALAGGVPPAAPGAFPPPPPPPAYPVSHPEINTTLWLVLSILTFFCCWPLGITGLIFSIMAISSKNSGNFEAAAKQVNTAKICALIGLIVGGIGTVLYIVLVVIGAAADM